MRVSLRHLTYSAAAFLAAVLALSPAAPALGATPGARVADSQTRVSGVLERLAQAEDRRDRAEDKLDALSARLDNIIEEQEDARRRLSTRSAAMYRMGENPSLAMLLEAESIEDFSVRWDLLTRLNRQDAADLKMLARSRAQAERAAEQLMELQVERVRAVETLNRQLADARRELAADKAALEALEAHRTNRQTPMVSKSSARKAKKAQPASAWSTAVASHYSRSFTGRGANGEPIGPYTMMVAHKTLPFGTLVEIEYEGRRAIAKVADRGPYTPGRDFDLGPGVVRALDFSGVHQIRWRLVRR